MFDCKIPLSLLAEDCRAYKTVIAVGVHQGGFPWQLLAVTAHGGGLNGCVILFGERAKLDELRRTDEFEGFVMNMSRHFAGLGVTPGLNWEGIQAVLKRRNVK